MEILKILTNSDATKNLVQFLIEKYHVIFEVDIVEISRKFRVELIETIATTKSNRFTTCTVCHRDTHYQIT